MTITIYLLVKMKTGASYKKKLFFFFIYFLSTGGAPDQLLLGRQQQPHGASRPQPALPGAVPHRRGAVQGPVQCALLLGERRPL